MDQPTRATVRDYDLTCRGCKYNLRGLPAAPGTTLVRCPECGHLNDDHILRSRRAAEEFYCDQCGEDLRGLPRLPGSGLIPCPSCGHRHIVFSGIRMNHLVCDRDVCCPKCRCDLRGVKAVPASLAVRCRRCGRWNATVFGG